MTTSLSSSLDVLSLTSSSRWASDSPSDEDEIVWSLSSSTLLSTSPPLHSPLSETADFVLVPRATAVPLTTADTIADEMAALSLTPAPHARGNADQPAPPSAASPKRTSTKGGAAKKTKSVSSEQHSTTTTSQQQQPRRQQAPTAPPAAPRKKGKRRARRPRGSSPGSASSASSTGLPGAAAAHATPSSRPSRISSAGTRKSPAKSGAARCAAPATTGLGARAVVDDSVSEASDASSSPSPAAAGYQEAHKYMTSYLAHPPPPGNNGSALLMLQALILELGCLPSVAAGKFSIPQLPATMRQAKLLLKSHAFINVRDYLAVREQGQAALQRAMHPNRTSLVKEEFIIRINQGMTLLLY
ncbi:hypothetical protein EDB92DRAFT_1939595 [Lactarius akahatsu]|uniref:Uncharacterized protein n=1 Tax=Lactarius akahatsu TaxID=416441 RepID=A0AAD4LSP2_9AGAM|nr:hypothetical protein EDB92DRAFT_1939595 [Lactarius akahatsu]